MGSFVGLSLIKPSLGEVAKCLLCSEQNLQKSNNFFSDLAHDSLKRNLLRHTDMRPTFRRIQLSSFLNNVTGWWQWQQEQRKSQVRILEHINYDLAAKIEKEVLLFCLRLVWQVEADVQVVVPILSKDHQDYQTLLCASLEKDLLVDLTRICVHSLTQVCQAQVLHLHQYWQTLHKESLDK